MDSETSKRVKEKDPQLWRDLCAYWIIGLCNNFCYILILSASFDILSSFKTESPKHDVAKPANSRNCSLMSTGIILLTASFPPLIIKVLVSFLPLFMNFRVFACCVLQVAGFLLTAFSTTKLNVFIGIGLATTSVGLGEASFLAYTANYNKNVISAWGSGTGASALVASTLYAGLKSLGLTTSQILLIILIVPVFEAFAFWLILRKAALHVKDNSPEEEMKLSSVDDRNGANAIVENVAFSVRQKFNYIPELFKYIFPLCLVYFLEYLVNQGLYELIYFPGIWLDHGAQYRWYQVTYQIAVFFSRSSVNIVTVKNLWIFVFLQFLNLIVFTFAAIYLFVPSIWIVFVLIFWEGLLGGSSYTNTFYKMSTEVPPDKQYFAFGIVVIFDVLGIVMAGLVAIPIHNAICLLPLPQ